MFKFFSWSAIPIVTPVLALLMGATFLICKTQDAAHVQLALSQYQQQELLGQEQQFYVDFIERRLRIEQVGSQEYLSTIEQRIAENATNELSIMILRDRFFFPYLSNEGLLFMAPEVYQTWKDRREQFVNPTINALSERRFGLNSEYFGTSNLVSYLMVDCYGVRVLINGLMLLLLGMHLEPLLGKGKMLLLFLAGGFGSAVIYVLCASANSSILQGASNAVAALLGALVASRISAFSVLNFSLLLRDRSFQLICVYALIILGKAILERWLGVIDGSGLMAEFSAILVGFILYFGFRNALMVSEQDPNQSELEVQNWAFRVQLADSLEAISAFNFSLAREKLSALTQRYPDAVEVLEQRYHLEKLQPDADAYWGCVCVLVELFTKQDNYPRMKILFEDIQKFVVSKQQAKTRLAPECYHKMMMMFVKHDDLEKAEQAYLFLELAGHVNIIKDACLLLRQEFKIRKMIVKERQYQMLLERM